MASKVASVIPRLSSNLCHYTSRSISSKVGGKLSNGLCSVGNGVVRGNSLLKEVVWPQRNFSSVNTSKGVHDEPSSTDKKSRSEEVPVQGSGHSSHISAEEQPTRRSRRDWLSDDFGFDSMFGPFRSFVPRHLRHPFRQMQRWMNRDAKMSGTEAEDQLSSAVRDMMYDFDSELLKPVSLTLEERETEYVAKMYLKGFQKSDLNLRIQDDYLIVNGSLTNEDFKDRKERGKLHSYSSQSFSRVLNLPDDVDRNNIHAKFEQNELIVQIPKDAKKKHNIEIH